MGKAHPPTLTEQIATADNERCSNPDSYRADGPTLDNFGEVDVQSAIHNSGSCDDEVIVDVSTDVVK